MKVALINSYHRSPFDDLFHLSPLQSRLRYVKNMVPLLRTVGSGKALMPLALPTLAALTPSSWEVQVYDEQVDVLPESLDVDVAGLSFTTHSAPHAYALADRLRAQGIRVVMGGSHATLLPKEAAQHADAVCIGEAEDLWPDILHDVRVGSLKQYYHASNPPDLTRAPRADFRLLDAKNYFPLHPIQTSRGCPHTCDFCTVPTLFGRRPRFRSFESVAEEIRSVNLRYLAFVDDNIAMDHDYLRRILPVLRQADKRWFCQANLTLAKDPSLLKEMHDSGCRVILAGLESVSPENLRDFASRKNKMDDMATLVRRITDAGIAVMGMFIVGFDHDTPESMLELFSFCRTSGITFPSISLLTPFPGTTAYDRLKSEKRLLPRDWSRYNFYEGVIVPKHLSTSHLERSIADLWVKTYRLSDVVIRAAKYRDMFPLFLVIGLGFRKSYRRVAHQYMSTANGMSGRSRDYGTASAALDSLGK